MVNKSRKTLKINSTEDQGTFDGFGNSGLCCTNLDALPVYAKVVRP